MFDFHCAAYRGIAAPNLEAVEVALRFWPAGALRFKSAIARAKARPILGRLISTNQPLRGTLEPPNSEKHRTLQCEYILIYQILMGDRTTNQGVGSSNLSGRAK